MPSIGQAFADHVPKQGGQKIGTVVEHQDFAGNPYQNLKTEN